MKFGILTILFCFSIVFSLFAQPKEGVEITVGIEAKFLLNPGILNLDSVVLIDPGENFRAVYQYDGGFGFGGVVRIKLTDLWNIETGINYTRRRFGLTIEDLDPNVFFNGETELRVSGYEIPLKGLVYIQMGKNIFMDVALGASLDFFASDVLSLERTFRFRGFKNQWANFAVTGGLGVEYRTEESGYFYVGATYHQMLNDMMTSQVIYFRNGDPPDFIQAGVLDGSYFSIDLRYFFPMQKPKRTDVKYVIPDWKNM